MGRKHKAQWGLLRHHLCGEGSGCWQEKAITYHFVPPLVSLKIFRYFIWFWKQMLKSVWEIIARRSWQQGFGLEQGWKTTARRFSSFVNRLYKYTITKQHINQIFQCLYSIICMEFNSSRVLFLCSLIFKHKSKN